MWSTAFPSCCFWEARTCCCGFKVIYFENIQSSICLDCVPSSTCMWTLLSSLLSFDYDMQWKLGPMGPRWLWASMGSYGTWVFFIEMQKKKKHLLDNRLWIRHVLTHLDAELHWESVRALNVFCIEDNTLIVELSVYVFLLIENQLNCSSCF